MTATPPSARGPRLQPAAGLLILAADWLFFGGNAATAGAVAPLWLVAGALVAAAGVYWIQTRRGADAPRVALFKALVAAVLVGVPFPIAGTFAGAGVLAAAGLDKHRLRQRLERRGRSSGA